jgi:hypothetical protein
MPMRLLELVCISLGSREMFKLIQSVFDIAALLLSSHVYWNFDGYGTTNSTNAVKDWELVMPFADQAVATDTICESQATSA